MDKRLAGLVGLSVLLLMLGSACSIEVNSWEVRNRTSSTIVVASAAECSTGASEELVWTDLRPGAKYSSVIFRFGDKYYLCPVVGDAGGRVIFQDTTGLGGRYEVTGTSNLTVTRTGEATNYNLKFTLWFLVAYLALFLVGLPFALFFTGQFFYRYHVSKTLRPRPLESGDAGPPSTPPPPAPITAGV